MRYYRLDHDHNIVPMNDTIAFARWFELADRVVRKDTVDGVEVSTVFLGIDHNFFDDGPPVLFETMVFGGEHDQEMERYTTWDKAVAGHKRMYAKVFGKDLTDDDEA